MSEELARKMVEDCGGKVDWVTRLPDGSGAMTASFPLPKDHWLYAEPAVRKDFELPFDSPPMPFRMGTDDPRRERWVIAVREAARYAVRAATMRGTEDHFDPDAIVQNTIVGMLGYYTPDGLSDTDPWANPEGDTPWPIGE